MNLQTQLGTTLRLNVHEVCRELGVDCGWGPSGSGEEVPPDAAPISTALQVAGLTKLRQRAAPIAAERPAHFLCTPQELEDNAKDGPKMVEQRITPPRKQGAMWRAAQARQDEMWGQRAGEPGSPGSCCEQEEGAIFFSDPVTEAAKFPRRDSCDVA